MKPFLKLAGIFLSLFILVSCTGPVGPPGPEGLPGPQGEPGGLEYAKAFEIITDFTPENEFRLVEEYGFEVFDSDVTLVYMIWEVTTEGEELWRLLPQTAFFTNGILQYNFDFTPRDVSIFLDGNVPSFASLPPEYRLDQVFRVVVVPAEFVQGGKKDLSYSSVTKAFGISEESFIRRNKK